MGDNRFRDRLVHAWRIFTNQEDAEPPMTAYGSSYSVRPDRMRFQYGNEKSTIGSIYNRIGMDVSSIDIRHVRVDDNDNFVEIIRSKLNHCLSVEANIDQSGRALIQDIAMSMFDEGVVAVVPVETTINPIKTGGFDIHSLRTGKIKEWYPKHILVELYDDRDGIFKEVLVPKKMVAIIENPLYQIMNEPNSTLKRLIQKINLLDAVDKQSGSGKLDIIIQLPYVIKSPARKKQAEDRKKDLEDQLSNSRYGIAYTDGTEKVIQLNRPSENNLMEQVEYLTAELYSQLGITREVFDGTADEKAMLNYFNRTLKPVLNAIVDGLKRSFLTKTAMSQGQSIKYFRDPFGLVAVSELAEIVDKFTRNEVMTSNEFRSIMMLPPSDDPGADELRNKNLNPAPTSEVEDPAVSNGEEVEEDFYERFFLNPNNIKEVVR
jgi:hypothetical protein